MPSAQSEAHDFNDLETSAIAERIDIADDDWTEGEDNNPTYKRTITIDGKHKVIQVDEPDSNGFYTGSYFEFNGGRFGDLGEVISHIDKQAKLAADIATAESEVNTDPTPGQKRQATIRKAMFRLELLTLQSSSRLALFAVAKTLTARSGKPLCITPTATFAALRALTATT